ncbi:MAG: GGDEF domain-containing protein [Ruminococcus sp.]|nr:GGDEF domain-containing protein [Ruminococcus sp.]
MKHKTIAVCVTGYDEQNEIMKIMGALSRCRELGFNLLTFFNSVRKPELNLDFVIPEDILNGEMQVLRLINYDLIDGIIVFGESMLSEKMLFEITEKAKARGIPMVDIDDPMYDICEKITLSNEYAMENVIRHLVEDHGLTKIDFINGFRNNPQSDERLAAYKKVLTEHGIPVEEDRIFYGEFWRKSIDCTKEIIARGELPEAIACANDTMAIFCMDTLKEAGYRIPEDIIVTGFDATIDSMECKPTLTTARRAIYESGIAAVDKLARMMNGESVEYDTPVESVLVKGESCGCVPFKERRDETYEERYFKLNRFKQFNRYVLYMNSEFTNIKSSEELYEPLREGCSFFNLTKAYACINVDIEHKQDLIDIDDEGNPWQIPDRMVSMLQYGHDVPIGTEFKTSELIPGGFDDEEAPVHFVFAPIYFKKNFLGYLAITPPEDYIEGDMFSAWLVSISNNTGSFYMNNELSEAIGELQKLYLRDPLTGLYNRRGLNKFEKPYIEKALEEGKLAALICADVDGLKRVNDNFGHEEGDNAIVRSSSALIRCFPVGSICVRTGGDEFLVIAAFKDERELKASIKDVYRNLEEYNAISNKPYKVGCSCGYALVPSGSLPDLDEIQKLADKNMYDEKLKRKTVRKD